MPSVITPIIDTAIGIVVVYIAFSLLSSWLGEKISGLMKTRAKMLVGAITQLLSAAPGDAKANKVSGDVTDPVAKAFFAHPIFQSLKENATKDPQYVSAQQFSSIVLGMVNSGTPPAVTPAPGEPQAPPAPFNFATVAQAARAVGLGDQVDALIAKANGDYHAFVKAIEDWYDDHMDRVSGWYVKHTQKVLITIGLILAILWNVDSLRLARAFSCNAALRTSVGAFRTGTAGQPNPAVVKSVIDAVPLGWDFSMADNTVPERALVCDSVSPAATGQTSTGPAVAGPTDGGGKFLWFLLKVIGLVLTAVALSQGANFWFDALSKLTRVRDAGKKPDKSPDASRA